MLPKERLSQSGDPFTKAWERSFDTIGQQTARIELEARRRLENAERVREEVTGKFRGDVLKTLELYKQLGTGNLEGVQFNLGSLFGEEASVDELRAYLSSFKLPSVDYKGDFFWSRTQEQYAFPVPRIPVTCNVGGEGLTFDSFQGLTKLGNSLVGFSALGELPVLVDVAGTKLSIEAATMTMQDEPNLYGFAPELKDKLLHTDELAAHAALTIYRDIAREYKEHGVYFKTPVIGRFLFIVPTRLDGSYTAEFAPEISLTEEQKRARKTYSPFAMVAGERNDCGDFIPNDYSSSGRIVLRGEDGIERLWQVLPVTPESSPYVQQEVEGTTLNRSMGLMNHVALFLFPHQRIEKVQKVRSGNAFSYDRFLGESKSLSYGPTLSMRDVPTIQEAAVTPGTKGWAHAHRRTEEYSSRIVPEPDGQPFILLGRVLTVSF